MAHSRSTAIPPTAFSRSPPAHRRSIEGTLAFDRLVLDPYLMRADADEQAAADGLFDWALLKYLDADLRISAGEIVAFATSLGRGGFTVSAKDGVVAGEIGELDLCDGSASGRLNLDLSHQTVKATWSRTLRT